MKKANEQVRRAARIEGIPLYAIARDIGISEPTICRWLRVPLSQEREELMLSSIHRLAERDEGRTNG